MPMHPPVNLNSLAVERAVIGAVLIDPDHIDQDGRYPIALPQGSRFLSLRQHGSDLLLWVISPLENIGPDSYEYVMLYVVPGGFQIAVPLMANYIGSIVVNNIYEDGSAQDWHVFQYPWPVAVAPTSIKARFEQYH